MYNPVLESLSSSRDLPDEPSRSNPESFWELIDAIYCINLISRDDRYLEAQKIFQQLNLSAKVQFHRPEKDSANPLRGCYSSHQTVINRSYQAGHKYIIIFEDDVIPADDYDQTRLQEVQDFITTNQEWELFYLGILPEIRSEVTKALPNYDHIRAMSSLCTHAYIVSQKGMRKYSQLPYADIPLDYLYILSSKNKSYGIYPSLFDQRTSSSDIDSKYDWFPWKQVYFRFIQNYSRQVNIPLNLLAWIIVIILVGCIIYIGITQRYTDPLILLLILLVLGLILIYCPIN